MFRWVSFFMLLSILHVSGAVFSQGTISISQKNVTIRQALEQIEQKSDFKFLYRNENIDVNKVIDLDVENADIETVLKVIFSGREFSYQVFENNVIALNVGDSRLNVGTSQQNNKVSGKVTDSSGTSLPGVTVIVKGTTMGVITDVDGNYTLSNVPSDATLVFSFVGMKIQEISVAGKTTFNVVMEEETIGIKDVVVTALGIKRDKKALSYSSQTISGNELKSSDLNFASILSGKVAGVELRKSTSGAGGSTKIVLRGNKNITSTNQPLFVIDGMPIVNYQTSNASGFYGGHDSGDLLSTLNPDDIESMTILKGANAAALYGSQGSNGVILITTKKGEKGKTNISINSTTTIDRVSEYPDLQFSYGQTSEGSEASWGEKGTYKNHVKDFFDTGITTMNSIDMSGGNDKTTTYFSYMNSYSEGVMPTNRYHKNNLTFRQSSKFFDDKLTVSSNIMLTDQNIHNKILNGYYWNPLLSLYNFPRGLDFDYYKKNYEVLDEDRNMMTQNWYILGGSESKMNPYWILHNDPNTEKTRSFIGNVSLNYDLAEGLSLSARGSYNYTRQIYELKAKAGSSSQLVSDNGAYTYSNIETWQAYGDMLLTYDHKITNEFDIHAVLGTSYQKKVIGDGISVESGIYGLTIANIFTLQNIASLKAFENSSVIDSRLIKTSVFSNVSLGYKKMVYLDLSGRNDWASSLAFTDNLSYFYPSAGLTFIVSEMATLPDVISFAKVRTSFARVSNEVPSFRTNPASNVSVDGVSLNTVKPFTELKPEMQNNLEFGLEMKFFGNRIGFDATYYQIDSKDQYLELDAPSGSGYSTYYVNAGHIRNRGVEISLDAIPVKTKNFNWNTTLNFSRNTNKILKLSDDLTGYYTLPLTGSDGYDMYVVEGGSMGDIYVYSYDRDDDGNIILDDTYIPTKNATKKKAGNSTPDWMLGWNNNFSYKNFTLSLLIDSKIGGKFVSKTESYLDANGVTQATADARDAGGVHVEGVLSDGTPYSGTVDAKTYYTGVGGVAGILEKYVYDATNVRLRQVSLGYTLNLKRYTKLAQNVTLSVVGSNLFFFYKDAPTDPDITISTDNGTQSVENFCMPATRSFGFNVNVNF